MYKILTAVLFLAFSVLNLQSQSFTFVRTSPAIVYNSADSTLHSYATINNLTSSNITIHIVMSNIVQPPQWDTLAFCTWVLCYGPGTYVINEVCPPGPHPGFYVYANPLGVQGSASCRITMSQGSTTVSQDFGFQTTPIGIHQISSVVKDFALNQNYPNPFNPSTKINFSLPKAEFVSLRVYDILGREVANLITEPMTAGEYEYEFYAKNLSSGMYYYSLRAGENVAVKKMVLVK